MGMSPARLGTKDDCAGKGQQLFTLLNPTVSWESEVRVSSYHSRALSFIVRRCYQAMTSEDLADWEDLVFAVVKSVD
jgi:hypothetical protein